jgi:hypothetical protein
MLSAAIALSLATGSAADDISVERGLKVSIVGGCHDCHTEGYGASEGKIDPEKALKGDRIGWRGPWGTTYALSLRISAQPLTEDGFVRYLSPLKSLPPTPWFNVRAMDELDMRSLYRCIESLGDPGPQAPAAVNSDIEPRTPYVLLAPPQQPRGCEKDWNCGVGQVCGVRSRCISLRVCEPRRAPAPCQLHLGP